MNRATQRNALIAGVVVVVLALVVWKMRGAGPSTAVTASGTVEIGRYFDWQLGTGKGADAARDLVSVPLIEVLEDQRLVPKLVKDVQLKDGRAVVAVKENVFWSDGKGFEAQHVVDAWTRARVLMAANRVAGLSAEQAAWVQTVVVEATSRYELTIGPLKDEAAMKKILADRLLRPIRGDLLGDKGDDEAFKVTLGPYRPESVATAVPAGEDVKLPGNAYFYQRPTTDTKLVKISELK